jgi:hypothetical protein
MQTYICYLEQIYGCCIKCMVIQLTFSILKFSCIETIFGAYNFIVKGLIVRKHLILKQFLLFILFLYAFSLCF